MRKSWLTIFVVLVLLAPLQVMADPIARDQVIQKHLVATQDESVSFNRIGDVNWYLFTLRPSYIDAGIDLTNIVHLQKKQVQVVLVLPETGDPSRKDALNLQEKLVNGGFAIVEDSPAAFYVVVSYKTKGRHVYTQVHAGFMSGNLSGDNNFNGDIVALLEKQLEFIENISLTKKVIDPSGVWEYTFSLKQPGVTTAFFAAQPRNDRVQTVGEVTLIDVNSGRSDVCNNVGIVVPITFNKQGRATVIMKGHVEAMESLLYKQIGVFDPQYIED